MWPVRLCRGFCLLMAVAIHPIHFGYTPLLDAQTTVPRKLGDVSKLGFAFNPSAPNTLYAATCDGIFTCSDGGKTWRALKKGLTDRNIEAVAIDPPDTSILYAEAYGGLFKSTTSGENWAPADTGLPANTHPYFYALNPKQSVHVYAASGDGIFESTNRGRQWGARNTGLAGKN